MLCLSHPDVYIRRNLILMLKYTYFFSFAIYLNVHKKIQQEIYFYTHTYRYTPKKKKSPLSLSRKSSCLTLFSQNHVIRWGLPVCQSDRLVKF